MYRVDPLSREISSAAPSDGFGAVFGEGVADHGRPAHRGLAGYFVFRVTLSEGATRIQLQRLRSGTVDVTVVAESSQGRPEYPDL
jgi:hypothetical protein